MVGPSTWAAAAQLMAARGFAVSVPDLTDQAHEPAPTWKYLVDAVRPPASVVHETPASLRELLDAQR